MQISADEILSKATTLIDSLWDETINNLSHQAVEKRQDAVNTILKKLNPQSNPEDNNILQSLPIAMLASDLHIGALYFLQSCISNGAYFDTAVIDATIWEISAKRAQCIMNGDNQAAEVILKILHQLYNIILADWEYQKKPGIYITIWADQERNKDTMSAIELYNEAMGLGSIDAYMYIASAYENQWSYAMSATILDSAYQLSGEIRFLHRLIHALCKSGKREEAYTYYLYLTSKSNSPMRPFIVYLEDVHNDSDLDAVSRLIIDYYSEWILDPSDSLASLAINSSVYIANEIEKESKIIGDLNAIFLDVWTDEHDTEYWRAISRRLYLMQTHIITLADPRYLGLYIEEMRRYTIDGNSRTQEMIRRFFTDSFSSAVLASYKQIIADATVDITMMRLYESMRLHLVQISAIFSQHSFYETIRDEITPFIESCMRQEWILDEEFDDPDRENIQQLRRELSEYKTYSPTTRKFYDAYIEFFDKKYGMFYRRHLQLLVRDNSSVPASLRREYEQVFAENGQNHLLARDTVLSNMRIFLDYSDIALLFLIEKIIAGQDIIWEDETIDMVVEKYQLHSLTERDAILFVALLYERGESYDDAMVYITSMPDILDVPQVLSMLTEWLRYMDDAQRADMLSRLDQMTETEYDAEDFFEQLEAMADDILNTDDSSESDRAYMFLAIAHMKAIRWEDAHDIQTWFTTAGTHGLSQWYIASGDMSQEIGDFDEAIRLFALAHLAQPDVVSLRRLIGCLIGAARFDEARTYIDIALREGYNISGFIFAWHLYQWNVRQSIEQMVHIHQSDGDMDMTMPEGCMELLSENIDQLLVDTTSTRDAYELKILASYINISMIIESEELDPENYIVHIDYIESMMNSYGWDDLTIALYHIMWVLVSDIDLDDKKSTTDKLTALLHIHFSHMHANIMRIHVNNRNKEDANGTEYSFNLINKFTWRAIAILRRFPDTESYLKIWRNGMNVLPTQHHLDHTIHTMPETVQ